MKKRRKPGNEAVEVGEKCSEKYVGQHVKNSRGKGKRYLKSLVCFAFGGVVFRCTTSFGAGLLLFVLFFLNDVLSMFLFLDELDET